MKCLVIDDDPLACELVEDYLGRIGGIDYCLKISDGATALRLLATEEFDAVFLDLNLPGINGISLLESLPRELPIIIISATPDFGARSYDFGIIDYLVKPLEFERFAKAIGRLHAVDTPKTKATPPPENDAIYLRDGNQIQRIELSEVAYVQAQSNYSEFYFEDGRSIMSLISMLKLEELLPSDFIRIHRSYIVNRRCIQRIENNKVLVGKNHLPIGQSYRQQLPGKLGVIN